MKTLNFYSISEFHELNNFPPPENPLFSVMHNEYAKDELLSCEDTVGQKVSVTSGFYSISLKNIISGEIIYGRTKYDCSHGTLLFTAPQQTLVFDGVAFSSEAYHIAFHKDYLNGTSLHDKIKKYHFFNYNVNEALHLSPKEEELLKTLFKSIEAEYSNNQDEFSKEIIIAHLEAFLKYADRFYKRQFLNRQEMNQELFARFTNILDSYFEAGQLQEKGIPTVDWLAEQLGVSHRYMSDTIKAETGKTAIDQINLYLINEAKNMLLSPNTSISETAYQLGFEYPQYFSRLFKKKVGVSPKQFIENHSMN
ncbi:MAG: helix-turn-helix domain-containing protein [Flavobacteriales bacterium]|jgi:AraC-like DNA-binding protein|nr:helix-turn-helix domain-containing protein [Flavobacteriales bacterium]